MAEDMEAKKPFMLVLLYVAIVLVAFAWRFAAIPWDLGGCFYQVWIAVAGTGCFAGLYVRLKRVGRVIALFILLPVAAFLLFGSLYFAPQALFPFMFMAFALAGALFLWSDKKPLRAVLVSLLLIPLTAYCLYGVHHIALLRQVRSIPPGDVAELRFTPASGQGGSITISRPDAISNIVTSLAHTFPYSPNHEGIHEPWRLVVSLRDGSRLELAVGNGNRAHRNFVWIDFGVAVYQNAPLRESLKVSGLKLWNAEQP